MAERPDEDDARLMDEVFDTDQVFDSDVDNLDYDLGDDDQEDEIREYGRYITDPPEDLVIRNRENDDTGRLGIGAELDQEWTRRRQREEFVAEDDRPAEVAAMDIVEELDD
ncbi:hypothetical protein [Nocardia concava]|uniref:hypothetical protein n=1 Tax=Nocardia concava TaxID=257281 RepID=UPI0002D7CB82|nr:hypothetical protein [Nocardia concava]